MAKPHFETRSTDTYSIIASKSRRHIGPTDLFSSDSREKHCPPNKKYAIEVNRQLLFLGLLSETFSLLTFQVRRVSLIVVIFNIVAHAVIGLCIGLCYLFFLSFLNLYTV